MLAYNSSFFHHVLFRWILSRLNHPLIFRFLCTSRQPSSYQHFRKTLPPSTIFILLCCFFSYRINHLFEKPTAIQIVERFPKTLCHRRPWNWSVRADRETWVGDQYGGQASDSATFRGVLCYRQEHARVFWWYFSFYYEEYVFYCEGKSKRIQGNVIFVYVR